MTKSAIIKNFSLTAEGILNLDDNEIYLEVEDGESVNFCDLLSNFDGLQIKLSVNHSENYK